MSDEAVALARTAFDAFSRRDLDAVLAILDEDVEFLPVTASLAGRGEPYRGHEGIRRYFRDVAEVWDELRVHPHEFREVGERVVALGRVYARGGGRVVDSPTGWVWTVREGRIVAGRVYQNPREALEAVGLRE